VAEPVVDLGFYHCTRQPMGRVAVQLCQRAFAERQRLLVVGAADDLAALDRALWVDDPGSFLPHGSAGGADDAAQPILLSETPDPANGAHLLLLLGVGLPPDFAAFGRVLNLFDDGSPAHERARADWRATGSRDGLRRSYWQQAARGWTKMDL
jgi:DNA polymerase-3 subunit chi